MGMDEGTIRMQAEMYALVAQMNSIIAEIEGMKAENQLRSLHEESPAYGDKEFNEAAGRLIYVLKHLREDI